MSSVGPIDLPRRTMPSRGGGTVLDVSRSGLYSVAIVSTLAACAAGGATTSPAPPAASRRCTYECAVDSTALPRAAQKPSWRTTNQVVIGRLEAMKSPLDATRCAPLRLSDDHLGPIRDGVVHFGPEGTSIRPCENDIPGTCVALRDSASSSLCSCILPLVGSLVSLEELGPGEWADVPFLIRHDAVVSAVKDFDCDVVGEQLLGLAGSLRGTSTVYIQGDGRIEFSTGTLTDSRLRGRALAHAEGHPHLVKLVCD